MKNINIMKKRNLILFILLMFFSIKVLAGEIPRRNIGFNFYWNGDIVEMVGNFRGGDEIVRLPMMRVAESHWTLTLRLRPGFYHFRYLLGREHWRQCPFIEDRIVIEEGDIRGNFTLLRVFPVDYNHYFLLGEQFAEEERLEWARDVYLRAVREFKDGKEAYIKLGKVYEELGQAGLALDSYTAAVENFPEYPDARYHLALVKGELYSETGNERYRSEARQQWIWLLDNGFYRREAREHLN